jgi:hypothetical protein
MLDEPVVLQVLLDDAEFFADTLLNGANILAY